MPVFSASVECIMAVCFEACPPDRFGPSCSLPCECENGATCDPQTGACFCPPTFTGEHCRTSTEECDDGYCLNGGTCSKENNLQLCRYTLL